MQDDCLRGDAGEAGESRKAEVGHAVFGEAGGGEGDEPLFPCLLAGGEGLEAEPRFQGGFAQDADWSSHGAGI